MDLKLTGKTALVTGGSEGIGKAIAMALAREGVDTAICARRPDLLERAAREISDATGRRVVPIPADLTEAAQADAFVRRGAEALGRVDIMVNNAGSAPGGVIETLSEDGRRPRAHRDPATRALRAPRASSRSPVGISRAVGRRL